MSQSIRSMAVVLVLALAASSLPAAVIVTAGEISQESAWLNSVGITAAEVQHRIDFDSFAQGAVVTNNNTLFPSLTLVHAGYSGFATSRSSDIGGADPDGMAMADDEAGTFILDFTANPVDYVSFIHGDTYASPITITFTNGSTVVPVPGMGNTSSDHWLFWGVFRNDQLRIRQVSFDPDGGDTEWGLDNIQYGQIPEPATLLLLLTGAATILYRRSPARR